MSSTSEPAFTLSKHALSRIPREYEEILKNPPHGIRLITTDSLHLCYAIITGPAETAYAFAPFLIKITFPEDYPFSSPTCILLTTGGGSVRFGPNLYACGKICLSILGTWSGPKWAPSLVLSSVLVSIQSLMSANAAQNEPGHERASRAEIMNLNNVLTHEALNVAVLGQMKSVINNNFYSVDICEAMKEHFLRYKEEFIKTARKMIELDSQRFNEPGYSFVTGENRIFRFAFLADNIEEQSKLLKVEENAHSYPELPPSPTGK